MDPVKNPFVPGAGSPPPELAGRAAVLEQARIAIARIREGRSSKSLILVGLRGVGKTVLLVRIKEIAENADTKVILVEARDGKPLAELLVPNLRQVLFGLNTIAAAAEKAKRALRVLRSFIGVMKLTDGDVSLTIEPERGTADSGDLEADITELLVAVGEAAKAGGTAVTVCIDELQFLKENEFSALIMAIHKINQMRLPVILVGAGLPQILGLAGEARSYSERLFDYPPVGTLSPADAKAALQAPTESMGVMFTTDALDEILRITECYPYFLQQWGHEAWNIATASPIDQIVVTEASERAIQILDESFFRVRFDRCNPSERRYLRALAELGPGPKRSGDIADVLNVKVTSVAPTRSSLIRKGMIYSPQHGDNAFTVPMFDAYMKRAMPGESWKQT